MTHHTVFPAGIPVTNRKTGKDKLQTKHMHIRQWYTQVNKSKIVPYTTTSAGHKADPCFLVVSLQVT